MIFTETHRAILHKLREEGKEVCSNDKERLQRVYFDSNDQQFKYWVDEWDVGEKTEILATEEEALKAMAALRTFAHPNQEEMWEDILETISL